MRKQMSIVAFAVALALLAGCNSSAASAFRGASSAQLQSGIQSVLDGLVSGGFAVYNGNSSSSASSAGTASKK